MGTFSQVEQALARLTQAVGTLEAAATRRLDAELSRSDLEAELAAMEDDRRRLASELDGMVARLQRLDATHAEVDQRLERAMQEVRAVIEVDGQAR